MTKGTRFFFFGNGSDVLDDAVQDVVRKGSWCKPVMLGRFDYILVVPDDRFELLLDCVGYFGGEPDVGVKEVGEKFVSLFQLFFDVVEVFFVLWTTSRIRSVFSLRVLISSFS